jgi:predicted nucleotidyltransferase
MIKRHRLPADMADRLKLLEPFLEADKRVLFAYVFGGLATGAIRPLSDVDIAVYLGDFDNLAETKLELAGRLSDTLGTDEIDLVILNNACLSLVGRIIRNRRVIVDKEPFLRHSFESRVMREFFDFSRKEESILLRRFGHGG